MARNLLCYIPPVVKAFGVAVDIDISGNGRRTYGVSQRFGNGARRLSFQPGL